MMRKCLAWVAIAGWLSLLPSSLCEAAEFKSDFDSGQLDETVWNRCQIDKPPLKFEQQTDQDGTTRRVVRIPVDDTTGNINDTCEPVAPNALAVTGASADDLGPSLVEPSPLEILGASECPKGGEEAQRNELRLQQQPNLLHEQMEPHWYSMTFRVDGNIPSCGSARWVLAQWKQERNGSSPFLAQRFDNGVLHITIQNGSCRCVVAKADGDPDAAVALAEKLSTAAPTLQKVKPIKCIFSDGEEDGECQPVGLDVYTLAGTEPPTLPDPKQDWVQMTYLVRGGSDRNGQVDIYANSNFIVRMMGLIGYATDDPGPVKFKFGHYRDELENAASISIDSVCLSKSSDVCNPGLPELP